MRYAPGAPAEPPRLLGLATVLLALALVGACGHSPTPAGSAPDASADTPSDVASGTICDYERSAPQVPDEAGAGSCTFALGPPPNQYSTNSCIDIFMGGVKVPHDVSHGNGWDYGDALQSIELYGAACAAAQDSATT